MCWINVQPKARMTKKCYPLKIETMIQKFIHHTTSMKSIYEYFTNQNFLIKNNST